MKTKQWNAAVVASVLLAGSLTGCSSTSQEPGKASGDAQGQGDNTPLAVTMVLPQVGDIPAKGNAVEKAIESYTNSKLDIQWVPSSAYEEKINVMITAGELPKIMKLNYVPTIVASMQAGQFWEVGPYLKEFKNLAAQDPQYYENVKVEGKLYGIPLYRDMGRATYNYRKDWFDQLGLKLPKTIEDWYSVQKTVVMNDPDKNGKNDTYGFLLDKKYLEGNSSLLTRLAVSMGGVNRWGIVDGKMTPEFMTKPYLDVMNLFRRLYEEKLINPDFAAIGGEENGKLFDSGRVGLGNSVAGAAKSQQDRLTATTPNGIVDNAPFEGPQGIRLAAEPGNNGLLAIPKSSVKTEAELKKLLGFLDKLMDEPMSTLQMRGIEGTHYVKADGGKTEFKDFTAFQREVKPYRDNLLNIEGYNVLPLKDTPLGEKGTRLARENLKYAIPNVALTLSSATYADRGKELEQMIFDAITKYIMGKIDAAGWEAEVGKWRKAGGDQIIKEYEASYAKLKK
ncbi:extracellular solute-binding protein [Paenibacillus rigui]|uniref:ABC transporter substrate-binding protein n=1 Tax=Paenibacillus rigui TaxID=554312 RepID=A0A229ULY0_9BACL|nr:extracellular solute-binding protein [Paenibacillus rigui]OXM84477.1 ABC transporter substrate-binding protein [Paenibacillus rigui]